MTESRDDRDRKPVTLGPLAHHIRAHATWTDITLDDKQLTALRTFCNAAHARATGDLELGHAGGSANDRGVTIFFEGASSTARTLAAEVVARELDLPLYRIDLSAVVNKYIGETEKNLRRLFDAAERNATVLFFDEADALFGKRTDVRDSHDRYANLDIAGLLSQLESHAGVAILATNLHPTVDPDLLRGFRLRVMFPRPPNPSHAAT